MNVAELLAKLVHLPGDLPVVLTGGDEMGPAYGELAGVDVRELRRDAKPYRGSPIEYSDWKHHDNLPPAPVLVLDMQPPYQPTVDGEVVDAQVVHEQREVPCPSCGNPLLISAVTLPGDQAVCTKCQQIVMVVPVQPSAAVLSRPAVEVPNGPTWRELMVADYQATIERYDNDTRVLATADDAVAELGDNPVTMPAVLASLDSERGRCAACGKPAPFGALCSLCSQMVEGPRR